jgi:serine/threonine protein kinase
LKIYTQSHREFFENEKFIYSLLKHPNILPYHGYQEFTVGMDTHLVLVFDLVQCNLREFLTQNHFSPDTAIDICIGVARGLSHLHNLDSGPTTPAYQQFNNNGAIVAHRYISMPTRVFIYFHHYLPGNLADSINVAGT